MRTKIPRLPPLKDDQLDAEQAEMVGEFKRMGGDFAVSRSFVRHPVALRAFRTWAMYVMSDKNPLPPRERELLALRTAWNIKSGYEWSRHIVFGRRAGLHDNEMAALKRPVQGSDVKWSERDVALIAAADELVRDFYVSDAGWAQLSKHFNDKQCMDAIFVVGHFVLLGMFLNTAGVPIDPDVKSDPELDVSGA